jgi:hypothetical protein
VRVSREEAQALVKKHGLPDLPGGRVLEMVWTARTGDWYVRTADSWYYCRYDARSRVWAPSVYGPTA